MFGKVVFRFFELEEGDFVGRFGDWVVLESVLFLYHLDFRFDVFFAIGVIANYVLISSIRKGKALSLLFNLSVQLPRWIDLLLHAGLLFP